MPSKYFIIASHLEEKLSYYIESGAGKLPSENTLCQQFGASRQTVRSALALLSREGYVRSVKGSGYMLTGKLPEKKNKVALLFSSSQDYIYPSLIRSLTEVFDRLGFLVDVCSNSFLFSKESSVIDELISAPPRLLIIEGIASAYPSININRLKDLEAKGCRILFWGRPYSDHFHSIQYDYYEEGRQITRHLKNLGHKNIAGIFPMDSMDGHRMYSGWMDEVWQSDSVFDPLAFSYNKDQIKALRSHEDSAFIDAFLADSLPNITALVCFNDEIAYWVIKLLEKYGLHCPLDISVAGSDGSYLSTLSIPIISTFQAGMPELTEQIASFAMSVMSNSAEKECIIKRSFKDRESISRIAPFSL